MKKSAILFGLILASMIVLASCTQQQKVDVSELPTQEITIFKSMSCGCCGIYAQYMEKEGFTVTTPQVDNLNAIKDNKNIPQELRSCHTAEIGDYFVEGHIPLEAIQKLLTEKPDIAGIAMPGMPSGSPGMPGQKTGTWIIYGVNSDGTFQEFMRI